MRIRWRVAFGLISQCVLVILLFGGITMVQLKGNIERDSDQLNAKISNQTLISFSYISDDIERYLFNMCRSENITSAMMSSSGGYSSSIVIKRFLYSLTESTDYVAGAYIIDQEHGRFSGYAQPKANVKVDHVRELYEEGFFDIVRDTQWCTDEDGNIYVRRDIYNSYPYKKIGYIIVSIDIQEFLALVGISSDSETTICVFSSDGDLIVDGSNGSVDKHLLTEAYSQAKNTIGEVQKYKYDGDVFDVYVDSLQSWRVMHLVLEKDKLSSYYAMNNTIRIIGAILCVLSIVLSWIVSHSLLKNIHSMMKQIKLIGGGKANKKIEISSHDEIGELADSFNQLLSKLDSVNQRIIAEGLEKERIKYELLNLQLRSIQTQIAPHLIGNLLGALSAYAVVGQTDKVESLSIHASNYIRSNAKCSEREYSTLVEEFQTIDNYIAMYQEIFDQPETYESHFEQEACRNMLVPSMLIHPLVENSLKYCGSGGTHGMANIRISAKHTEKLLELRIEDTSSPFPEDVLAALEEMKRMGEDTEHKLGFGLAGTIRRLSLLYGDDYDFRIVQTDEFHKSIIVTMPVEYADPSA